MLQQKNMKSTSIFKVLNRRNNQKNMFGKNLNKIFYFH